MYQRKYYTLLFVVLLLLLSSCQHSSSSNNYESLPLDEMRALEVAKDQRYLIKNVNLISMTEETVFPNRSILIEEGVITMIGDLDSFALPADTIVLPCDDLYVIPGLSDMHVHANDTQSLQTFLAYGVTLVRNMMGSDLHLKRRDNIKTGELLGPEMFVGTKLVDGPNPMWPQENPAKMLGIDDRVGTIELGKDADLLVLRSNPLEEITNTLDIAGVMTKGRWLDEKWILKKR